MLNVTTFHGLIYIIILATTSDDLHSENKSTISYDTRINIIL